MRKMRTHRFDGAVPASHHPPMAAPYDLSAILPACAGLPVERFAAGSVLIAEGPAVGHLYVLISGAVEVLRGETQISTTTEPGAIYGEMSALLGPGPQRHRPRGHRRRGLPPRRCRDGAPRQCRPALPRGDDPRPAADRRDQLPRRPQGTVRRPVSDHFGMVDTVLDALVQRQRSTVAAGSDASPPIPGSRPSTAASRSAPSPAAPAARRAARISAPSSENHAASPALCRALSSSAPARSAGPR